jgi:hypothetical protein
MNVIWICRADGDEYDVKSYNLLEVHTRFRRILLSSGSKNIQACNQEEAGCLPNGVKSYKILPSTKTILRHLERRGSCTFVIIQAVSLIPVCLLSHIHGQCVVSYLSCTFLISSFHSRFSYSLSYSSYLPPSPPAATTLADLIGHLCCTLHQRCQCFYHGSPLS